MATISLSPTSSPSNVSLSVDVTGVATDFTAHGTFTISGGSSPAITATTITDATHATLTVSTGAATGALTISNAFYAASATLNVYTDIPATVYSRVFALQKAGIDAYNAAIDAGTLAGCKKAGLADDDRTDGRLRSVIAKGAPDDYPSVRLSLMGGTEQKTVTPTFGLMAGSSCDAIIPMIVALQQTITHDGGTKSNTAQTPLEAYIDKALHAGYPKLGLTYCRGFTFNDQRRDRPTNGISRTVRTRTINVDLWLHLAQVQ